MFELTLKPFPRYQSPITKPFEHAVAAPTSNVASLDREPASNRLGRAIVIVTPWFPNRPGAAAGSFVSDSAMALAARGWKVGVLVCRPWRPRLLHRFVNVMDRGKLDARAFSGFAELRLIRFLSPPRGIGRSVTEPFSDRRIRAAIERMAKQIDACIIHAHAEGMAPAALAAGRALRLPVAVSIHGLNTDPNYLHPPRQKARLASALRGVDRVILVGEPLRSFFSDYIERVDHVRVVPNGTFLPIDEPQPPFPNGGIVRLISVGNLQEGKGIDLTLTALAWLNDAGSTGWHYRVVGEGPERARLERMSNSLGLDGRVTFAGAIAHHEVRGALTQSDVFVMPSFREAFGIAYLEAMAMGRIAIGVKGQGPAQFIRDGETGFLVPPNDSRALADLLGSIMTGDRSRWRAIAAAGALEARNNWSWDAHARSLEGVFSEIANPRSQWHDLAS